jgi:formate hydrogenlyase subunit 6/NADH:ubiquinone oxidoreductase subunit I
MAMEEELIKSLKKKPVTILYPYKKEKLVEGIRAKVTWIIERCVGCKLCVKICPSEAINLEGKGRNTEVIYNVGRCIFCGECIEVCPTETIYNTKEFELAFENHKQMIIEFRRSKEK